MAQNYEKTREKPNIFMLFRVIGNFGDKKTTKNENTFTCALI